MAESSLSLAQLYEELKLMKANYDNLETDLIKCQRDILDLRMTKKTMSSELDQRRLEVTGLNTKIVEMEDEFKAEIKDLKEENLSLKNKVIHAKKAVTKSKEEIQECKMSTERMTKVWNRLHVNMQDTKDEVTGLNTKMVEMEDGFKAEIKDRKEENLSLKNKVIQAEQSVTGLSSRTFNTENKLYAEINARTAENLSIQNDIILAKQAFQQQHTMQISVLVTFGLYEKFCLEMKPLDTIGRLKDMLVYKQGIPQDKQQLFFGGKTLEDHRTLADYNIVDKSEVVLFPRMR